MRVELSLREFVFGAKLPGKPHEGVVSKNPLFGRLAQIDFSSGARVGGGCKLIGFRDPPYTQLGREDTTHVSHNHVKRFAG